MLVLCGFLVRRKSKQPVEDPDEEEFKYSDRPIDIPGQSVVGLLLVPVCHANFVFCGGFLCAASKARTHSLRSRLLRAVTVSVEGTEEPTSGGAESASPGEPSAFAQLRKAGCCSRPRTAAPC